MLVVEALRAPGVEADRLILEPGRCIALMGPSGGGKSRLLRAIADLDPNEGRITLDGEERSRMSGPAWRRRVTYVAAEPGWWAERVGDHVPDVDAAAPLAIALQLPGECMAWPVARLSTGERQRLALVRALVRRPRVLLLDEPTSGLDERAGEVVERLLADQRSAAGTGILWVTHDPAQAQRVSDGLRRVEGGVLLPEAA